MILDVNEDLRRIVASVPASRIVGLQGLIGEYSSAHSIEAKASCRVGDERALKAFLEAHGFKAVRSGGSIVYYGVLGGRLVEVEISRGGRARVKVGAATKAARITMAPPPSLFLLSINDKPVKLLDRVLSILKGRVESIG